MTGRPDGTGGVALERVLVIGAGLIGTSVGLALRQHDVQVWISDPDDRHGSLAETIGAGDWTADAADDRLDPQLVVVGAPPSAAAEVVADALRHHPGAVVTDLASVKQPVIDGVAALVPCADRHRYVPAHPMAGSERSGPLAARHDLFDGRAWAVVTDSGASPSAIELVRTLIVRCGAVPVEFAGADHDRAVALVSHLPHVAAATVAGLLADAPADYLALAGQGVRDVTRVAGSDPVLWQQILSTNGPALAGIVRQAATALGALADDLTGPDPSGPVTERLQRGVDGVRRLPGKHGRPGDRFATVDVVIPDRPGALARLFADVTDAGVNIEDIRIDHDVASAQGHAELSVVPDAEPALTRALTRHGWSVAG